MAKDKDFDNVIPFGKGKGGFDDDIHDGFDDEDFSDCPGINLNVNLNINISSAKDLEKAEEIIDRLAEKYGFGW